MVHAFNPIKDPFLNQNLNPLFLQLIQKYWDPIANIKHSEEASKAKYHLIQFVFRKLFMPLFLLFPPKPKGEFFLLSAVHHDGMGDFFALLKLAKLFRLVHPLLDIQLVYTYKQNLPPINLEDYLLTAKNLHPFQETSSILTKILEPILEGQSNLPFENELTHLLQEKEQITQIYTKIQQQGNEVSSLKDLIADLDRQLLRLHFLNEQKLRAQALYQKMKNSLALVQIALAINTFENPLLVSRSLYFSETGNFQGIGNFLFLNWYSMGLLPFEEGIFLKSPSSQKQHWENAALPLFLFNSENPDPDKLIEYFTSHNLYVGYLPKQPKQQVLFILLICMMQKTNSNQIDVILPTIAQKELLEIDKKWLAACKISSVVLIEDFGKKEKILVKTRVRKKKVLRLIHALPLSSSDFAKILSLSEQLTGCTGDISLSECLIMKKIPFYEIRPHKIETIESFRTIAINLKLKDIENYFSELIKKEYSLETQAENLSECLKRPTFQDNWEKILLFIEQYYCLEDNLIGHLNHYFYMSSNSYLKNFEDELADAYLHERISSQKAIELMKKELIHLSEKHN